MYLRREGPFVTTPASPLPLLPPSLQVIYCQKDPDCLRLTNLLSITKVKPSLDVFHSQLSDEDVAGWRF